MTTYPLNELAELAGTPLGTSAWMEITQDRIDRFADATGDHQWIHVDPERAARGPFGTTIAHGYLTLALLIPLFRDAVQISGVGMAVNYGLNRVRFPAPVPVRSRVRLAVTLAETSPLDNGGLQAQFDFVVEVQGADKPACAATAIYRYFPDRE